MATCKKNTEKNSGSRIIIFNSMTQVPVLLLCMLFVTLIGVLWTGESFGERIKDVASIKGVRDNQLVGY
ncbi:MAG: hypothetical protein HQK89_08510, partial [Nitrospirae bacterium]|nr:hypothetical protein [Nitrospirota bacterium]